MNARFPLLITAYVAAATLGCSKGKAEEITPTGLEKRIRGTQQLRVGVIGDSFSEFGKTKYGYIGRLDALCTNIDFSTDARRGRRTQIMNRRFNRMIGSKNYDYVIVQGGVNDFAAGRSLEHTKYHLAQMYEKAKQSGAHVVAVTLGPWSGYKKSTRKKQRKTRALNRWIRNKPKHVDSVVDFYTVLKKKGTTRLHPKLGWRDGLHPNGRGNKVMAKALHNRVFKQVCRQKR